jgi:hypothetical protein
MHQHTSSAEVSAPPDGNTIHVPRTDAGADTLSARGQAERAAAARAKVFHGFRFEDRQPESRIGFTHRIVDDAGKTYKAAHYDHGNGVAAADVDGDGLTDVYFTSQLGGNELWQNLGDGTFRNVTAEAGVGMADRVSVSAAFADVDNDGDQDLYVTTVRMGNALFENDGKGKFRDITKASGMGRTHGKALVVAFTDVDRDGRMDFYIGNDGEPADMMRNRGGLRFENVGMESGLAYGALMHAMAAMGADWGDYDRDGQPDLAISGFSDEAYAIYRAAGQGQFDLVSDALGISGVTYKPLGFGTKWIDMDNDGWLDLVFVNGHVYDNVNAIDPLSTYRQPPMLFHNQRGRKILLDRGRKCFYNAIILRLAGERR